LITSPDYDVVVDRKPEEIAGQLLSRSQQVSPPVDLEKIITDFTNIKTEYTSLTGTGYLVDLVGSTACILIEKNSQETRRSRFTLAHELGHWILHRFAEKSVEDGPPVKRASTDQLESWCDNFATELLMPSPWITDFAGNFERVARPQVLFGGPMLFDVSREAFYLRLGNIYGVDVIEMAASGKVTTWSRNAPHIDEYARRRLTEQVSPNEWKRAETEPFCKGPFQFAFRYGPRWIILIVTG